MNETNQREVQHMADHGSKQQWVGKAWLLYSWLPHMEGLVGEVLECIMDPDPA